VSVHQNTGRVAVITGASSGIGEATARALAADGHAVALLARRAGRVQVLADELGDGAIAVEADVTDRNSIVAAAARVKQELGGADILVNNAGVMLTAPFSSDQREEHRHMVETNLLGAMTATEVFLDQLRANERGDGRAGDPRPGHRRCHRLRGQPTAARHAQRDPRTPHRAGDVSGNWNRVVGEFAPEPSRSARTRSWMASRGWRSALAGITAGMSRLSAYRSSIPSVRKSDIELLSAA